MRSPEEDFIYSKILEAEGYAGGTLEGMFNPSKGLFYKYCENFTEESYHHLHQMLVSWFFLYYERLFPGVIKEAHLAILLEKLPEVFGITPEALLEFRQIFESDKDIKTIKDMSLFFAHIVMCDFFPKAKEDYDTLMAFIVISESQLFKTVEEIKRLDVIQMREVFFICNI
jgi:hypothetical protein